MKTWKDIEGWFSDDDAAAYCALAKQVPKGGILVEVGVWLGRSIFSIADIAVQRRIKIIAVDTWLGSEEHATLNKEKLFERFLDNVVKFKLERYVTPLHLESTLAARVMAKANTKFDLVFIDAAHDSESVKADIAAWLPLTRKIAGHDYTPGYCGVPNAVDELLPNRVLHKPSCIWSYDADRKA